MTPGRRRVLGISAAVVLAAVGSACADRDPVAMETTTTVPDPASVLSCTTDVDACVTDGADVTLEVHGPAADPTPVRPSLDHALATIDRDAGVSAVLRDGSVLWLFGDTAARNEDGTVRYFVIGTGAWASADAPTVTQDAVDPTNGEPVVLAMPTADFPMCPQPSQRQGMWPASAVVQHVGSLDRVVIWLENVCLGGDTGAGPVLDDEGMAVAEWWYDPADPPLDRAVTATVLNQRLFVDRSYGMAAALFDGQGSDGGEGSGDHIDTYSCDTPAKDAAPTDKYGPCTVARTNFDEVADPASYDPWIGDGFGAGGVAAPIKLPAGSWMPYPVGGFTVTHDAVIGAYVMAYSPWPGSTEVMEVRVAADPLGPWSSPVTIHLPGCDDHIGSRQFGCYAASAQPAFSTPGHLGIGYYDSLVSTFPTRGAYQVSSVSISVRNG